MRYLILILTLIPYISHADDILVGQLTHHFVKRDDGQHFKDTHPLIGYASGKHAFIVMENSFDKTSALALRMEYRDLSPNIRGYLAGGLATGYAKFLPKISAGPLTPVLYGGFDLHPDDDSFGLLITIQPAGFIGAGLRVRI